jgi:hypothetical protein
MRYTNKHNLPDYIVKLVMNDGYTKGDSRMSVTSLISAPRQVMLAEKYGPEIEVDVSDRIPALFGKVGHKLLEDAANASGWKVESEERIEVSVDGWKISGGIDQQVLKHIDDVSAKVDINDFKFTTAYAAMNGKSEWECQLNAYAWFVETFNSTPDFKVEVDKLNIVAFIRDWKKSQAGKDDGYPPVMWQEIEVPLWSYEERDQYVRWRVAMMQDADTIMAIGDERELPLCTDEERWIRPDGWIATRPEAKRATKKFETQEEAEEWVAFKNAEAIEKKTKKWVPLVAAERKGEPLKCMEYCQVAHRCSQWQAELRAMEDSNQQEEQSS